MKRQRPKTPKLAPCPWCGKTPIVFRQAPTKLRSVSYYVECCYPSCAARPSTLRTWSRTREVAAAVWNRRAYTVCGSTSRLVTVLVGRVLGGEDPKHAVADYAWEHDAPPDLGNVAALVALREAVREFATNYGRDIASLYADWHMVAEALRRADRKAGRGAR